MGLANNLLAFVRKHNPLIIFDAPDCESLETADNTLTSNNDNLYTDEDVEILITELERLQNIWINS